MTWATAQAAIVTAIQSATGLTDVRWQDEIAEGSALRDPVHVDLVLRSPRMLGTPEYKNTWNGASVDFTVEGQQIMTVSVRIMSESQTPGADAVGQYAGRMRNRLYLPSIRAALNTADVACLRMEQTQNLSFDLDGHQVSLAQTDVFFGAVIIETDDLTAGDWIETVEVSSTEIDRPGSDDWPLVIG